MMLARRFPSFYFVFIAFIILLFNSLCAKMVLVILMKTFNKLVRDKIPEIISNNGEQCTTRVLDNEEYLHELNTKLSEEVNEYLESSELEELADIFEVLYAILDAKNVSKEDLEDIRIAKVEKRGAFKERIFLENTY